MSKDKDEEMDWGDEDFHITSEIFDELQSQAVDTFEQQGNVTHNLNANETELERLKEAQYANEGQIKMLRSKLEEQNNELNKEKAEKQSVIESRLKDEKDKQARLNQKIAQLESMLKFKDQDLISFKERLGVAEKKLKERRNSVYNSPKKARISLQDNFLSESSFYKKTSTVSKIIQTDVEMTNDFPHELVLGDSSLIVNRIMPNIICSSLTEPSSKNTTLSDNQINVFPSKDETMSKIILNMPVSNASTEDIESMGNYCYKNNRTFAKNSEMEFTTNVTDVLTTYLDFISKNYSEENGSVSLFSSSEKGTPEPVEMNFFKWNLQSPYQISWRQFANSVESVLKLLLKLLSTSSALRDLIIRDTLIHQPFLMFRDSSQSSSASSSLSKEYCSPKNENKVTISSVLFAAVIPIRVGGIFQNHQIVKLIFQIFKMLLSYCDECCIIEYSSLVKHLCLSSFILGTFSHDLSILALEILSLTAHSSTIRDIFSRHGKQCTLRCMSKNVSKISSLPISKRAELVLLEIKILSQVICYHGVGCILNLDCSCLRAFMSNFLKWFRCAILNDEIDEYTSIECFTFLQTVAGIKHEQMSSVEQKMQKLVLIVQFAERLNSQNSESPLGALITALRGTFPMYKPLIQ